ncbi:MSMEG_1061 family FMN-dependent PPOX-type flavoprotein [Kribbella sp. NPDC058693]|uniref:Pyridoxamine 5'-phosphate oxidase family protein n=1 Tax=Kribbella jiaozuonensis TaxID=2575441 RepID=A0A4U3LPV8_9ACTN|nr:MSMEG_1061 family FMN-dependent PPOX-type flavoprotein [Kribbella jiaozuonensis]TKK76596.1 pyridoxamine 5'-phosphate oxidase family protein [Kribbella jiaozuonensis]
MEIPGLVEITSYDELRELVPSPMAAAAAKERKELHDLDLQWLDASPFCLVATADADGNCDVSPKGDPAGFTKVLDRSTIAIPDRAGNRRVDGFTNILSNPHVGLIYFVPGRTDTLRINGRARIVKDAPFFDDMIVKGNRPQLALLVEIEQIFHHCSKSFMRSKLWKPETWNPDAVPRRAVISQTLERPDEELTTLDEYYGPQYEEKIYKVKY